jgi:hypothetical protein
MSSLTASEAMVDLLRQAKDVTEIRDITGNVIGIFAPQAMEEVGGKGSCYTTRAVFEHLLSVTNDQVVRNHLLNKIEGLAERQARVSS